MSDHIRERVINLVKKYWGNFFAARLRCPIDGHDFVIDTGDTTPVCCCLPSFVPHNLWIINKQLGTFHHNGWTLCAWDSNIVLAPKPDREQISNIEKIVWCMYVSYHHLNRFTKPVTCPIPRSANAIKDLGAISFLTLWFISLEFRQEFHQIIIRFLDQEKTEFFTPDGDNECFTVMHFGPTNGKYNYIFMMYELRQEWIALFPIEFPEHTHLIDDSRTIINAILNLCTDPDALIDLFECICIVFLKYRVSFHLDTCIFFNDWFEYVGHAIISKGNCQAQSKFDMIQDWPRSDTAKNLLYFISLCRFYQCYVNWFTVFIKEMCHMVRTYSCSAMPDEEWTEKLNTMFTSMKTAPTSSPILA
jgi:hypothetical protein